MAHRSYACRWLVVAAFLLGNADVQAFTLDPALYTALVMLVKSWQAHGRLTCYTSCVMSSDLLEEDEEPLDIYPHARLSPCLFTLLTVLFAPGKVFKGWSCIEGKTWPEWQDKP